MRACRYVDQLRCNQRDLEIAVELGELAMQLTASINLGVVYGVLDSRAGDHDAARERIEQALVLATLNDELEAVRTRAARARIHKVAGDPHADDELHDLETELVRLGTKRELAVLRDLREVR